MNSTWRRSLFFLPALLALLICAPAFPKDPLAVSDLDLVQREEGKGLTDHGGGGAFIKSKVSHHFVFWDLFSRSPNMEDSEKGDQIRYSRKGLEADGEWINYSRFKSNAFLKARLELWKNAIPSLVALLQRTEGRDLSFIATDHAVADLRELAIPYGRPAYKKHFQAALPGAIYDYSTELLFVNITVWNGSGLQSQAAMLLHERLRRLQKYFDFSNNLLQDIVYAIIMVDPKNRQFLNLFHFQPFQLNSLFAQQEEARSNLPKIPSPLPFPAEKEVQDAQTKYLLAHFYGANPQRNIEEDGFQNDVHAEGRLILSPRYCSERLPTLISEGDFACKEGEAFGNGSLFLQENFSQNLKLQVNAKFWGDSAFTVEALAPTLAGKGIPVTFQRTGNKVVATIASTSFPAIELNEKDSTYHLFVVFVDIENQVIKTSIDRIPSGEIAIPAGFQNALTPYWNLRMDGNVLIHYLASKPDWFF